MSHHATRGQRRAVIKLEFQFVITDLPFGLMIEAPYYHSSTTNELIQGRPENSFSTKTQREKKYILQYAINRNSPQTRL